MGWGEALSSTSIETAVSDLMMSGMMGGVRKLIMERPVMAKRWVSGGLGGVHKLIIGKSLGNHRRS